jgi:antitoxin component of MazEF toxin-antitoxin module
MTQIIKFTRSIRSSGRSAVIAIPPDLMKSLEWTIGDEITIQATQDRGILIQRTQPHANLDIPPR